MRAQIPEKVTTDGVLALEYEMKYAEVEAIIGPPLCIVEVEDNRLSAADRATL
jgi:hypothetical protein